jgi:DNA polymerase-4
MLLQLDDMEEKKIRLMGLTLKNADAAPAHLPSEGFQLSLDFKD